MKSEIYVIANIVDIQNNRIIGFRITDILNRDSKYKDVSYGSFYNIVSRNSKLVSNSRIINGAIDIYNSKLSLLDSSGNIIGKPMYVVVRQLGNLGYTLVDYKGNMKKLSNEDVLKLIDNLANVCMNNYGSLVPNSRDFKLKVESIKLHIDNTVNNFGVSLVTSNSKKVLSASKAVVANNISKENIFDGLTDNQVHAIQSYYLWYTTDIYNNITKHSAFVAKPGKAIKLAALKKDYIWYFGGIIDRGFLGASSCSLGHDLRYEYIACGVEKEDDFPHNIKERIKFGETCSSDFFSIPKEDMKKLVKIRKFMSEEIGIICSAKKKQVYDGNDRDWKSLWDNVDFIKCLIEGKNLIRLTKAFGNKVGSTLKMFYDLDIPFPDSLVKLACEQAFGNSEYIRSTSKADEFYRIMLDADSREAVVNVYEACRNGRSSKNALNDFHSYFDYVCYYGIGGKYAYNPIERTGKRYGAFNKATRYERYRMLLPFKKFGVRNIDYAVFMRTVKLLNFMSKLCTQCTEDLVHLANKAFRVGYRDNLVQVIFSLKLLNPEMANEFAGYSSFDKIYSLCKNVDELVKYLESLADKDLNKVLLDGYLEYLGVKYLNNIMLKLPSSGEFKTKAGNIDVVIKSNSNGCASFIFSNKNLFDYGRLEIQNGSVDVATYSYSLRALGEQLDKSSTDVNNPSLSGDNKDNTDTEDTKDKLKLAYEKVVGHNINTYLADIVRDMYSRGLTDKDLSYKQSKIVSSVLSADYQETADSGRVDNLSDEILKDIVKIIEACYEDAKLLEKLKEKSSITLDVLETIRRNKKMSKAQSKYYTLAKEVMKLEKKI